jgi:hypothetical protein
MEWCGYYGIKRSIQTQLSSGDQAIIGGLATTRVDSWLRSKVRFRYPCLNTKNSAVPFPVSLQRSIDRLLASIKRPDLDLNSHR